MATSRARRLGPGRAALAALAALAAMAAMCSCVSAQGGAGSTQGSVQPIPLPYPHAVPQQQQASQLAQVAAAGRSAVLPSTVKVAAGDQPGTASGLVSSGVQSSHPLVGSVQVQLARPAPVPVPYPVASQTTQQVQVQGKPAVLAPAGVVLSTGDEATTGNGAKVIAAKVPASPAALQSNARVRVEGKAVQSLLSPAVAAGGLVQQSQVGGQGQQAQVGGQEQQTQVGGQEQQTQVGGNVQGGGQGQQAQVGGQEQQTQVGGNVQVGGQGQQTQVGGQEQQTQGQQTQVGGNVQVGGQAQQTQGQQAQVGGNNGQASGQAQQAQVPELRAVDTFAGPAPGGAALPERDTARLPLALHYETTNFVSQFGEPEMPAPDSAPVADLAGVSPVVVPRVSGARTSDQSTSDVLQLLTPAANGRTFVVTMTSGAIVAASGFELRPRHGETAATSVPAPPTTAAPGPTPAPPAPAAGPGSLHSELKAKAAQSQTNPATMQQEPAAGKQSPAGHGSTQQTPAHKAKTPATQSLLETGSSQGYRRVEDTKEFPYSAVGRVRNGCTGTFVSPHLYVTSASCVVRVDASSKKLTWAALGSLEITPGLAGAAAPLGPVAAEAVYVPVQYVSAAQEGNAAAAALRDVAIVRTARAPALAGHLGVSSEPGSRAQATGYPSDKAGEQWTVDATLGTVTSAGILKVNGEAACGAAVHDADHFLLGVHSTRSASGEGQAVALRGMLYNWLRVLGHHLQTSP